MKRSAINASYRAALACFTRHHWHLPPNAKWDITDFGLGDFENHGLTLINLATEPEYCEKLMYARKGQVTPKHKHALKKEDIICRVGELTLELWSAAIHVATDIEELEVPINGELTKIIAGKAFVLPAGSRITLNPGLWHAFYPSSEECIIGEVSTANDDANDNFFTDPNIGRFPDIEEDEAPLIRILPDFQQSP
ncbi:MAG: D-lyxose/D-mannose family sugar isomerase [Cephaloticoccus sp.]|nr:D-lyxose/D-mannose family sugar isomerase [Cephaloticoccus sp.]MCF7761027.1 D-lyxose/D-mannose family sugar isomerase [Cephaloticoccus sp.]